MALKLRRLGYKYALGVKTRYIKPGIIGMLGYAARVFQYGRYNQSGTRSNPLRPLISTTSLL